MLYDWHNISELVSALEDNSLKEVSIGEKKLGLLKQRDMDLVHPADQKSRPLQQRPRAMNLFFRDSMARRLRCRHIVLLMMSLRSAASFSYGMLFAFVKYEVCFVIGSRPAEPARYARGDRHVRHRHF